MTQPADPAPAPTSAPPAPTPPASAPPAGQLPTPPPAPMPQQGGWLQQQGQPYPQQPAQGYPGQQPMQYVPVMPIPPTVATSAPADGQGAGDGQDLSKLPQWVQKQITDLRDENAKRRVSERTAVVNQHAWVAAQQLGVNGQALFGSLAWQRAAEQLDPSKADFGRHLAEMIHTTLRDNPWMAAQQQPAYPPAGPGQPGQPGVPGQQPEASPVPPGQPAPQPQGGYPGQPGYPPQPQPYPGYQPAGYPTAPGQPYGAPQPPPGWLRPPTSGGEFAAGNGGTPSITEDQLAQMTPNQIKQAYDEGRLKHLM